MYKTADAVFNKNGIIVFTGPPGCGKSIGGGDTFNTERTA